MSNRKLTAVTGFSSNGKTTFVNQIRDNYPHFFCVYEFISDLKFLFNEYGIEDNQPFQLAVFWRYLTDYIQTRENHAEPVLFDRSIMDVVAFTEIYGFEAEGLIKIMADQYKAHHYDYVYNQIIYLEIPEVETFFNRYVIPREDTKLYGYTFPLWVERSRLFKQKFFSLSQKLKQYDIILYNDIHHVSMTDFINTEDGTMNWPDYYESIRRLLIKSS